MAERLNILLVSPRFPPAHGGGGLRILRTYQRVSQILPITLVVITEAGPHHKTGWGNHAGWPVYAVPPGLSAIAFARAMAGFRRGGLRRFSAIHLVGLDVMTKRVGLLGYLMGIPLVTELTVDADVYRPSLRGKLALTPFRRARLAIALSGRIAGWMRAMGVPSDHIWQRPNPVDTAIFRFPTEQERNDARAALKLPVDTNIHLVFGRFCDRKNQRLAVAAFHHMPDGNHLVLAGPAFDEDQAYVKSVTDDIARLGLSRQVTLLVDNVENAASLYFAADQLWMCSRREGLPNVMLEALCCGVPVIANDTLGLDDHIGGDGAVAAMDPQAFAMAAQNVLPLSHSIDARSAISRRAAERYDADRQCRAFADRLSAVIGAPRSGSATESRAA